MKKISELTEQEILSLKSEEIDNMIKLAKAEAGIKLIKAPEKPEYFTIESPDKTVYIIGVLGNDITFTNHEEAEKVVSVLKSCDSTFKIDYDYGISSEILKMEKQLYNKIGYGHDVFGITSKDVYSPELHHKIIDQVKQNAKMKSEYEKQYKEYQSAYNESKYIEDEINERIQEVKDKYYNLNLNVSRFKEYLTLAEGNEEIAMNFLCKAYTIDQETKEYVLANYKD